MLVCGKNNTYKVVDNCQNEDNTQKWFQLECVDFYDVDNLGDQIMCNKLGEKFWIANYHFLHMVAIDK